MHHDALIPRAFIWLFLSLSTAILVILYSSGTFASDLLVGDTVNNAILRYNSQTGAFVSDIQFSYIQSGDDPPVLFQDMAIGPDGNIYVGSGPQVSVYDGRTGQYKNNFRDYSPLYPNPPITFGPDGNFYTSGDFGKEVLRFDGKTGAFIDEFCKNCGGDRFLFGPDGNLYIASGGASISVFDGGTGEFITNFFPNDIALTSTGMAFGPDGNLYVTNEIGNSVFRFSRNATTWQFLDVFVSPGSGGLSEPKDIAFGPDGNVYVASYGTRNVLRFDGKTGVFMDEFIPPYSGGLLGPERLMFVASGGNPGGNPPGNPGGNPISLVIADLSLNVKVQKSVKLGKTVKYVFTVKNKTRANAPRVVIKANLEDGASYINVPAYCGATGQNLTCQLEVLLAKKQIAFTVKIKPEAKGLLTVYASVDGEVIDHNPRNNTAVVSTNVK